MMAPWREMGSTVSYWSSGPRGVNFILISCQCHDPGSRCPYIYACPSDPRRLKKDLYMFASIQSSSGAQIALTHAAYNYVKKVKSYVVEVES